MKKIILFLVPVILCLDYIVYPILKLLFGHPRYTIHGFAIFLYWMLAISHYIFLRLILAEFKSKKNKDV